MPLAGCDLPIVLFLVNYNIYILLDIPISRLANPYPHPLHICSPDVGHGFSGVES
jgi:hypothetical protein